MENKRNFVGGGKQVQGYPLVNFSICLNDIPKDDIFEYDGKKYIKLTIGEKKGGADQYGKTHSVWVDEYKPDTTEEASAPAKATSDSLPF